MLGAQFDELPDVAVAGEIELPGLLFQMAPDDVKRDGVKAAGFHLEDGFLPRFLVRPRGVHFARNRHEWFPADFDTLAGHDELGPLRVDPAPGVGADGLDRPGLLCVERVEQLFHRRSSYAFGAFGAHRDVVQARGRSFDGPELNSDVCARRDFGSNQHRPISWNEFFHRKRSVTRPKNSDAKDCIRPPHLQNIAFQNHIGCLVEPTYHLLQKPQLRDIADRPIRPAPHVYGIRGVDGFLRIPWNCRPAVGNTAAPAAGILSSQTGYIAKVSVFYGEILLSFRGRIGCVTE